MNDPVVSGPNIACQLQLHGMGLSWLLLYSAPSTQTCGIFMKCTFVRHLLFTVHILYTICCSLHAVHQLSCTVYLQVFNPHSIGLVYRWDAAERALEWGFEAASRPGHKVMRSRANSVVSVAIECANMPQRPRGPSGRKASQHTEGNTTENKVDDVPAPEVKVDDLVVPEENEADETNVPEENQLDDAVEPEENKADDTMVPDKEKNQARVKRRPVTPPRCIHQVTTPRIV